MGASLPRLSVTSRLCCTSDRRLAFSARSRHSRACDFWVHQRAWGRGARILFRGRCDRACHHHSAPFAAFVTGMIQSLGTAWGLFRHYWVVAKLLISAFAVAVLLAQMGQVGRVARGAAEIGAGKRRFAAGAPLTHRARRQRAGCPARAPGAVNLQTAGSDPLRPAQYWKATRAGSAAIASVRFNPWTCGFIEQMTKRPESSMLAAMLRRLLTPLIIVSIALSGAAPSFASAAAPVEMAAAGEAMSDCAGMNDQEDSNRPCDLDASCIARCHLNTALEAVAFEPLLVSYFVVMAAPAPATPLAALRPGPHFRPPIS